MCGSYFPIDTFPRVSNESSDSLIKLTAGLFCVIHEMKIMLIIPIGLCPFCCTLLPITGDQHS